MRLKSLISTPLKATLRRQPGPSKASPQQAKALQRRANGGKQEGPSPIMARIPEETLQQILAATDIVELIGRTVKLRRAGGNWLGLCPFHNEKTPSFNVRPSTASFHCFGCGASGNAFRFLMNHDGLSFMEAVERLAQAANIRIEREVWDANAEEDAKKRSGLIRVHQLICAWYHQLLMKSPLAQPARDYLKGRGINQAIAKNWQLGYAPADGTLLRHWAKAQNLATELLCEAGILARSEERGDTYPRFRDRLMFPIRNDQGDVIAFSGRLLQADAKAAKYLNSPETAIFSKSRVLFGFDRAKRAISKSGQAIICEGQIDTLMLHEAGFTQAVAGQGTAFTEFHARALKRQADEVVLCYDSDNAGIKAAEKAFRILAPAGLIIKMLDLPAGEDPDSLIRKQGSEAFAQRLAKAVDFLDYQTQQAAQADALGDMRQRVRFAAQLAENIATLENTVARATAIQRAALRLSLPEESLTQLVKQARKSPSQRPQESSAAANQGAEDQKQAQTLLKQAHPQARILASIALGDAEVLDWLRSQPLGPLLELPGTELLSPLWQGRFDATQPAALQTFVMGLPQVEQLALNLVMHQPQPGTGIEAAEHALRDLEIYRLKVHLNGLQTQLKQPNLDAGISNELQREVIALHQDIQRLQKELISNPQPPGPS